MTNEYLALAKKLKAERQKDPSVSFGSTQQGPFPKKTDPAPSPSCVSSVTFSIFGVKMPFDDFSVRLWEHFVDGGAIPFPMDLEQLKRYRRVAAAEKEVKHG